MVALYKGATPIIRRYKGTQLIYDSTVSDNDGETLSFAWSGTSATMQYKINGTTYTAKTNPYSTTLTELGVDEFTNADSMFNGKTYITAITSIPDTSNVTNMNSMFNSCRGLTSLDVTKRFNTSNVTNMYNMFYDCRGLTSLDVSNFNTSNVTTMKGTFYKCSGLTSLDVSNFNTSNVTTMDGMFYFCSKLTSLDLSNFNTSKVNNMKDMFNGCSGLTSLELSNFNLSKVTNMNNMFRSCSNLAYLDISGWDLRNVSVKDGMFSNDLNLTTIIMNGCDCDTILFVRQQIQNIGNNHIGVVQTDTVCPTYESYAKTSYTINNEIKDVAWNEQYKPDVLRTVEAMDLYGVKTNSTYNVSDLCNFVYEPSDNNETNKNRTITVTVYIDGEKIGEVSYTQLVKPQDVGDTFYLSCNAPKDVPISELIIDMNDVPPADGWWFGRFSANPNGFGDCEECYEGDISISLHENMINGEIHMQIKDLPKNDEGKYVLTFGKPFYFQCAEQNFAFDNVLCVRYVNTNVSLRLNYPYEFNLNLNNQQYMIHSDELTDNGDNTYTLNKEIKEIIGDEPLTSCANAFTSINTRLVEVYSLPITSEVTQMNSMFNGCSGLTSLDVSNWDTSNVSNMSNMFWSCYSLQRIDGKLDWSSISSYPLSFISTNWMSHFSNFTIKNLGKQGSLFNFNYTYFNYWGDENNDYPLSEGARQTLVDSLVTYSYDRVSNGEPTCTIQLNNNTRNRLMDTEIAEMSMKGFTIA